MDRRRAVLLRSPAMFGAGPSLLVLRQAPLPRSAAVVTPFSSSPPPPDRQLLAARFYDGLRENVHEVGDDVVEETLIVRATIVAFSGVRSCDTFGEDAKRIDVEAESVSSRIRAARVEHGHLEVRSFFLAARESLIDRAAQESLVHFDELELFVYEVEELERVDFFLAVRLPYFVVRRAQEVGDGNSGNLDRILEREKDPVLGAHFGIHFEEILPGVKA